MRTSGRRRLGVRISQDVWVDEVERLSARSRRGSPPSVSVRDSNATELSSRSCSPARTWVPMGRGCEVSTRSTCRSAMLRHPRGPSRSCSRWPSETVRCTCGSSRSERGIRRAERGACTSGRTSAFMGATQTSKRSRGRRRSAALLRPRSQATRNGSTWRQLEPAWRAQVAHGVGHVGLIGALRRISGNHRDPKPGALP